MTEEKLELADVSSSMSPSFKSPENGDFGKGFERAGDRDRRSESSFLLVVQIVLFVVVTVVVWALFSLPIIFYETEVSTVNPASGAALPGGGGPV